MASLKPMQANPKMKRAAWLTQLPNSPPATPSPWLQSFPSRKMWASCPTLAWPSWDRVSWEWRGWCLGYASSAWTSPWWRPSMSGNPSTLATLGCSPPITGSSFRPTSIIYQPELITISFGWSTLAVTMLSMSVTFFLPAVKVLSPPTTGEVVKAWPDDFQSPALRNQLMQCDVIAIYIYSTSEFYLITFCTS